MLNFNTFTQVFLDGRLLVFHPESREWLVRSTISSEWLQAAGSAKRVVDHIRSELAFGLPASGESQWIITIPPCGPSGFSCDLSGNGRNSKIKMLFGELEDSCGDLDTALTWLGRALSDSYRLRTRRAKNRILSVRLEPVDGVESKPFIEMGYRLWPIGPKIHEEVFRQNALSLDLE